MLTCARKGISGESPRRIGRGGTVDGARLEDGDVRPVAGDVVAGGVEQRADQRGAHDRLRVRHGVLERDDAPQLVPLGQQQPVEQLGVGEAPSDDLAQAAADHRVLGGAAHALGVREPAGGAAARGQRRGQPLEAVDARDLLDQVDLARDVVAPEGGHRHLEPACTASLWKSSAFRMSVWRWSATGTPRIACTRASRRPS